jgi:osmotically-inducible protein OsmY
MMFPRRFWISSVLLVSALSSGCVAPLLVVGGMAAGGVMVNADRRSAGTQLEDESIELKAAGRVRTFMNGRSHHLNVTSFNRVVLITGEVMTAPERDAVAELVASVEQVRSVINESVVGFPSSLGERSQDALLTTRVRAALLESQNVNPGAFKVVTERGVVYLMGLATQAEADRAVALARNVSGVRKVVQAVEILSTDDVLNLRLGSGQTQNP